MSRFEELTARRPSDINAALTDLGALLDWYHQEGDYRAIFLRAQYLVAVNVQAAVQGRPRRIFFDAAWVSKLLGKFASLYLESLDPVVQARIPAWKVAHGHAAARDLSVAQDLLLGLNAHLNFDQPLGIYLNLVEHGDHKDHQELPRRKFDHDQLNNILVGTIPLIQQTLTRDYGGELELLGRAMGSLDELMAAFGLKFYRERVWWNAVTYLSGRTEDELELIRSRMNLEALLLAQELTGKRLSVQRAMGALLSRVRRRRFGAIDLERPGAESAWMDAAVSPF